MDHYSREHMQVARLSRKHALYSALTFIYTHALDDYVAPIAELVAAMVADTAAGGSAQRHLGFKLLAFLHCCLHGRTFPPGAACCFQERLITWIHHVAQSPCVSIVARHCMLPVYHWFYIKAQSMQR